MKAKPYKIEGQLRTECAPQDATHIVLRLPGPSDYLMLPVMLKGTREGTSCWSWNGSTESPTLKPSLLSNGDGWRCHSFVTDGMVRFLSDSTHEFKDQNLPLLEV